MQTWETHTNSNTFKKQQQHRFKPKPACNQNFLWLAYHAHNYTNEQILWTLLWNFNSWHKQRMECSRFMKLEKLKQKEFPYIRTGISYVYRYWGDTYVKRTVSKRIQFYASEYLKTPHPYFARVRMHSVDSRWLCVLLTMKSA